MATVASEHAPERTRRSLPLQMLPVMQATPDRGPPVLASLAQGSSERNWASFRGSSTGQEQSLKSATRVDDLPPPHGLRAAWMWEVGRTGGSPRRLCRHAVAKPRRPPQAPDSWPGAADGGPGPCDLPPLPTHAAHLPVIETSRKRRPVILEAPAVEALAAERKS